MHARQNGNGHVPPHNYFTYEICPKENQGCAVVQAALQEQMDLGWIQHTRVRDVNVVQGFPGEYKVYRVEDLEGSVVIFQKTLNGLAYFKTNFHPYRKYRVCRREPRGCQRICNDIQGLIDNNTIIVLNNINGEDEVIAITPLINKVEPMEFKHDSRKTTTILLVIFLQGPIPYESEKVVPYKYNITMMEDGKEVPLPHVVKIVDISRVTRS